MSDLAAVGKRVGDAFEILFDEAHGADFHRTIGIDQENCRDARECIGVRDRVALFVEKHGESHAVLFGEVFCFAGVVLGDAKDSHTIAAVTLKETLKKGKRELANGAGNFEKGDDGRTFFECGFEGVLLAVERFQGEVGCPIACDDVGHSVIGSKPARELAKD